MNRSLHRCFIGICLVSLGALTAHAAAPALSSRPGAAYTVYLNYDGFSFTGQWGDTGRSPGVTAAYTGSEAQLRETWARTAEKFVAFDVNVTTVDPAVAAGQAGPRSPDNATTTTRRA